MVIRLLFIKGFMTGTFNGTGLILFRYISSIKWCVPKEYPNRLTAISVK